MKKNIVAVCCLLLVSFFACENDDNSITPDQGTTPPTIVTFEDNFGSPITARFLGSVVDENSNPVRGAIVRIRNTVTSTDIFGIFSIENANAFEQFAYITVEKEGYITGSRAVVPSETEVNRIEIMLLEEEVIATVNSGENSTVSLPNGATVTFDGGFIKPDGSSYSGAVQVILHHLNPDDANMSAMMPGMLFAQDANGNARSLETYGMLSVELRSDAGEELQLAQGSISELRMLISPNATNPPATIPLWYFDEEAGYWKEEGQATLQGNIYVGEVTHFSFWNCDVPYALVNLCITLVDEGGRTITYTPISLSTLFSNMTGSGYTNGEGTECGLVPFDQELIVTVPDTECDGDIFTTTIGPFTTDADITITVTSSQISTILSGTFLTCDGNNVTDGYLQLFVDGELEIVPITNGIINHAVYYCNTGTYSIEGIDITNNQTTNVINGNLSGETTIDIGAMNACIGFADTDGDGVFDLLEDLNQDANLDNDDTDQDGLPNYQDPDDDGDGINTADEDYDGDNDPTNEDSDGDGTPDYLDAEDVIVFSTQIQSNTCTDPQIFDFSVLTTNLGDNLHTYAFYATEADANAETNPLPTSYSVSLTNLLNGTTIYVKATNNASSQTAIGEVALLPNTQNTDGDALTDCEELTGIDDPSTGAVPSGTSDPNDPNDPTLTPVTVYITMPELFTDAIGQLPVTFNLGVISDTDTVINISTSDGTATGGSDYTSVNTTITIPAGQLSEVVNIPITNDGDFSPETFTITGTVTSGNTSITSVSSLATIHRDFVFYDVHDAFGYENEGTIAVKVALSVPDYSDTTINFSTTDGTATNFDYSLSTNSLVIPAGETLGILYIDIVHDDFQEDTESFEITSNIINGSTNVTYTNKVYIYDDDDLGYRNFAHLIGCDFAGVSGGYADLTTFDAHFLNGNAGTVSYFEEDYTSGTGVPNITEITNPESYGFDGSTLGTQVYILRARIENPSGNVFLGTFERELSNPLGISYSTDITTICDSSDGNVTNGIGVVNLVTSFRNNYNEHSVSFRGLVRTYYESLSDAESSVNAIVIPENYRTTSSSQTIYVRIVEPLSNCTEIQSFTVNVDSGC